MDIPKFEADLLGDKMPRGEGFVNDFLRGSPDYPGCREAGRRAGTSMGLSQNCFTKPALQGILSVSTGHSLVLFLLVLLVLRVPLQFALLVTAVALAVPRARARSGARRPLLVLLLLLRLLVLLVFVLVLLLRARAAAAPRTASNER